MPRAIPRYPCKPSLPPPPSPHHNRRDSIRSLSPFQPDNKKKKSGYTNCSSQQRTDYCIIRKGEKAVITINGHQPRRKNKQEESHHSPGLAEPSVGRSLLLPILQRPPEIPQPMATKQELVRVSPAVAVGVDLSLAAVAAARRGLSAAAGVAAGDGRPAV